MSALVLLPLAVVPGWGLEILYPAAGTSIVRSDFLIIKAGNEPPIEQITVEFGGAKSGMIDISGVEYRKAFDDFVILLPGFEPGRDTIRVEGFASGKRVAETSANFYFLTRPGEVAPPEFAPFVMHLPEKEKLCAPCHNMNPAPALLDHESAEKNPCGSCHRRRLDYEYVHGPAGVFQCTYCHEIDSSPAKYVTRIEEAPLCGECHEHKIEEFRSRKFIHGPIEAGLCSVCHDSHASAHFGQLTAAVNDLCLSCHSGLTTDRHVVSGMTGKSHPLEGPVDPSDPNRRFSCIGCHDPHGGNTWAYFQRGISSRMILCQMCHKK
jgi:predicted CXXCH cytochrome family protein